MASLLPGQDFIRAIRARIQTVFASASAGAGAKGPVVRSTPAAVDRLSAQLHAAVYGPAAVSAGAGAGACRQRVGRLPVVPAKATRRRPVRCCTRATSIRIWPSSTYPRPRCGPCMPSSRRCRAGWRRRSPGVAGRTRSNCSGTRATPDTSVRSSVTTRWSSIRRASANGGRLRRRGAGWRAPVADRHARDQAAGSLTAVPAGPSTGFVKVASPGTSRTVTAAVLDGDQSGLLERLECLVHALGARCRTDSRSPPARSADADRSPDRGAR